MEVTFPQRNRGGERSLILFVAVGHKWKSLPVVKLRENLHWRGMLYISQAVRRDFKI